MPAIPIMQYLAAVFITVTLFAMPSSARAQSTDERPPDERRLDISFLFHFNQDLAPLGPAAADVAYTGLLETLRARPELPFQIQISGTLMNNLQWFDPRPLDLIREGVEDGQFEIWGSTYSQNVMFASGDAWTNDQQIKTHRRLLKETFGVEPAGFWNPERVWTQDFVPLLAENGYRFTTIEQHILESSPGYTPGRHLRTTRADGAELTIINDDTEFLRTFDAAVASGSADSLLLFLAEIYEADTLDRALVAYFQDAEAMGLWQVERGEDPHVVWEQLDGVLTELANQDWIRITTGGRFIAAHPAAEDLTPIADGQADWMIAFSRGMGYEDWYDYFERDHVQVHFRPLFAQVRDSLHAARRELDRLPSHPTPHPAVRLFERAIRTFLAHEYEFGASWYWTPEYGDFNLVRETLVSLLAVRHALHPAVNTFLADINIDGVEEVVMVDSTNLYVFAPEGGRLLYWFDLEDGASLVGNENYSFYTERYVDGGRYIPSLEGGRDVYPWLRGEDSWLLREGSPEIFDWTFDIRRTALSDWMYADGALLDSLVHRPYDVRIVDGAVHFSIQSAGIEIDKIVSMSGRDGLSVEYVLRNQAETDRSLELVVDNAFSPSYVDVMDRGPGSLEYVDRPENEYVESRADERIDSLANEYVDSPRNENVDSLANHEANVSHAEDSAKPFSDLGAMTGVRNVNSGATAHLVFEETPTDLRRKKVVFGLELNPVYTFNLKAGTEKRIRFSLVR